MQKIIVSRAPCDDCLQQCFFTYNEATGQTTHIDDFTEYTKKLDATGWIYKGHRAGQMTFTLDDTRLSGTSWQIIEAQHTEAADTEAEYIDVEQDW